MSSDTKERVKRYFLYLLGVSAHFAVVVALLAAALGLDLNNLSLL